MVRPENLLPLRVGLCRVILLLKTHDEASAQAVVARKRPNIAPQNGLVTKLERKKSALKRAKQSIDIGRALGLAAQNYAADSEDYMPSQFWLQETLRYVKPNVLEEALNGSKTKVFEKTYICPSPVYPQKEKNNFLVQDTYVIAGNGGGLSQVGENIYFAGRNEGETADQKKFWHPKITHVKQPSSKIYLLEDGMRWQNGNAVADFSNRYAIDAKLGVPHGSIGNILRADGGSQSLNLVRYISSSDQYAPYRTSESIDINRYTVNQLPKTQLF